MSDPLAVAAQAAQAIRTRTGVATHDVALVMGSGWSDAVPLLGDPHSEIHMSALPGFAPPAVEGHSSMIQSISIGGHQVLVMLGRTHLYEGHGVDAVTHGVRTGVAAGAKVIILTNACGGINAAYRVGEPVLVRDHISFTATSPLSGAHFVDLTTLYSPRLRELARKIDRSLKEGVYAHWRGPTYETPAEINMMRILGADLVGMSTVPEAIAAHALGAEVLAISLVTNPAAGVTGEKLDHHEVIAAGRAAATRMGALLRDLITRL